MTLIFKSPRNENFFFGYYGKSQLDFNSKRLLALKTSFFNRMPEEGDTVDIGYFDINSGNKKFIFLTKSKIFNWQQGCMLQWLGPSFEKAIIYNDIYNKKFCSIIMNVKTKQKNYFPFPIYDVNYLGTHAICVDQERHFFCRRGYSYAGIENRHKNKKVVVGDGIWILNLNTKKLKQIIKIEDLINFYPLSNMKDAVHYVEHLMFNPMGSRFCFLHRWKMKDGGIYSRFFTANIDGKDLFLLLDSGRMSHFCWRNNNEILAYGGLPTPLNKLRRKKNFVKFLFRPLLPIYHFFIKDNNSLSKQLTGDCYFLIRDKTSNVKKVALDIRLEDGHPSFFPNNKNLFVTDTYPKKNNNHLARLILYNIKKNNYQVIDELKSNENFDETPLRCDLHPKISFDGNYISVDTMNKNYRSTYLYKIKNNLNIKL